MVKKRNNIEIKIKSKTLCMVGLILIYVIGIVGYLLTSCLASFESIYILIYPVIYVIGLTLLAVAYLSDSGNKKIKVLLMFTGIISILFLLYMVIVPSFSELFGEHINNNFFAILFKKINLSVYELMIFLSLFIGMLYIYVSMVNDNFSDRRLWVYFLMFASSSIIFCKYFTIITNPSISNFVTAGLSSYGGLVGILLSAYIFEKMVFTEGKIIKNSVISLPLIYAVTKVGCFLVGCCYGIPYDGPLAVWSDKVMMTVFPIQLLETVVFFIIFILLNVIRKNKNIVYIAISLVVIMKFLLDFLRYEHITKMITVNQIFSILLMTVVLIVYIINKKKNITR